MMMFNARDLTDSFSNSGSYEYRLLPKEEWGSAGRHAVSLDKLAEDVSGLVDSFNQTAIMKNIPQFFDACFSNENNDLVSKLSFSFQHIRDGNTTIHVSKTCLDINAKPFANTPIVEVVYHADKNNICQLIIQALKVFRNEQERTKL